MKNKIARSIITVVLLCVTAITLIGLCSCQKDSDTQPSGEQPTSGEQPQNVVPDYDAMYTSGVKRMYAMEDEKFWEDSHDVEVITSVADWKKYDILGPAPSEYFFNNRVILLIQFRRGASDRNIEFKNLAIKDGKFYPVFAVDSPTPPAPSNGVEYYKVYVIEASKAVLEYQAGNILIINREDVTRGSCYYKSITKEFN